MSLCETLLHQMQISNNYYSSCGNQCQQRNLEALSWFEIVQVPREENAKDDALARLTEGIEKEGEDNIPIEVLTQPYV